MTDIHCLTSHDTIKLHQRVAKSGEGEIYKTSKIGLLAKIYHLSNEEKVNKLKVMVKYPPTDPTAPQHVSIAWPKDLLEDDYGKCVGFLMPEIERGQTLMNVYHPVLREKNAKGFNWLYLHTAALNIASVLQSLHISNYVVGDLKPDNLLVNDKGLVSIIDTDSFQIIDPITQKIYRSPVSSEEFTPREMFGQDLQVVDRTEFQDRFGLAVIIWLLLFGYHPFKGKWIGSEEPLDTNELIRYGHWMYGANSKIHPVDSSIPLDILHPLLRQFFHQCFDQGHSDPFARPSAASWVSALDVACKELEQCLVETEHYYSKTYGRCNWCLRKQQYEGYDIFPATSSSKTVSSPTHNLVLNNQNFSNQYIPIYQSISTSQTNKVSSNSQKYLPVNPHIPLSQNKTFPQTKKVNNTPQRHSSQTGNSSTRDKPKTSIIKLSLFAIVVFWAIKSVFSPSLGEFFRKDTPLESRSSPQGLPIPYKEKCGDVNPPGNNIWYPVLVQGDDTTLEQIQQRACGDALPSSKEGFIQVASFLEEEDALAFAELMKSEFGSGEVGQAHHEEQPIDQEETVKQFARKEKCGDSNLSGENTWYRVLVREDSATLEQIQQRACGDALSSSKEGFIQVASFLEEEDALAFAELMKSEFGSGEVEQAYREPKSELDGENQASLATERVQFDTGSTETNISDRLATNQIKRYLLWCRSDQVMIVQIQQGSVTVKIVSPDGQIIGETEGDQWREKLPTDGDYVIEVSVSSGSNYSISIEVL